MDSWHRFKGRKISNHRVSCRGILAIDIPEIFRGDVKVWNLSECRVWLTEDSFGDNLDTWIPLSNRFQCSVSKNWKRLFTFSLSSNVIPKKLRESNKAVLLQKEIFDEEEQTRQGFVNGDISERKRGVGWGVDEVCTLALHTAHCSLAMHSVHRESGFNGRWRDGFSHFPTVVCCVLFTSDKEDSITTHWHDIY